MRYQKLSELCLSQAENLYALCGWSAYLTDRAALQRAFENSLSFFGAYEQERLIGFARCVGDEEHVVLIQDLLVDPAFWHRGIGTELLSLVLKEYRSVRSVFLLTDADDPRANGFYQKIGLIPLEKKRLVGYLKP